MKKRNLIAVLTIVCIFALSACGNETASENTFSEESLSTTDEENKTSDSGSKDESQIVSDPLDNELGWDGEWTGGGVSVTINGAGNDWCTVDIVDEEMHTSLDEVSINGNTLTGVYRITLDMYPDPDADLPEQEWTITMVKEGAHASYSRVAVLTWYSLNDDGTYGREITKENSASLTLVTNTVTN